jgi:hypothetical protein
MRVALRARRQQPDQGPGLRQVAIGHPRASSRWSRRSHSSPTSVRFAPVLAAHLYCPAQLARLWATPSQRPFLFPHVPARVSVWSYSVTLTQQRPLVRSQPRPPDRPPRSAATFIGSDLGAKRSWNPPPRSHPGPPAARHPLPDLLLGRRQERPGRARLAVRGPELTVGRMGVLRSDGSRIPALAQIARIAQPPGASGAGVRERDFLAVLEAEDSFQRDYAALLGGVLPPDPQELRLWLHRFQGSRAATTLLTLMAAWCGGRAPAPVACSRWTTRRLHRPPGEPSR